MRKRRLIAASMIAAGAILLGGGGWHSGWIRGACSAVLDHARSRPSVYSLGCTNSWPHEALDFRVRELLLRDYGIAFETIGGIAPSDYAANFVVAYDSVSYRLMRLRFGNGFDDEVQRRAAADVYDHEVVLDGCYWMANQLVTKRNETFRVSGPDALLRQLSSAEHKTVRLHGMVRDIRGSQWRSWGWPQIHVDAVEILGARCGNRD